jgi:hypothetical protein
VRPARRSSARRGSRRSRACSTRSRRETSKLRRTLGAPDRAILDEYLSNIREVEQQLDRMETRLNTITGNPESPIGLPEAFDDHMSVTYNLMHLALQGDISRVFTFMIGHEPTDRSYAHIGCPETHSQHLAPRQRCGEARQVRQDRHLPDGEVRRVPRQDARDEGRRRQRCSITRCSTGAAA